MPNASNLAVTDRSLVQAGGAVPSPLPTLAAQCSSTALERIAGAGEFEAHEAVPRNGSTGDGELAPTVWAWFEERVRARLKA